MSEEKKINFKDNMELVKTLTAKLQELDQMDEIESLIKNNTIEFNLNDKTFRVRKPGRNEKMEANKARNVKYIQLLQETDDKGNPVYIMEAKLIEAYKKQGIDIGKMDAELRAFESKLSQIRLRLAPSQNAKDVEILQDEILNLAEEKIALSLRREELLQYCLEKQLTDFSNMYLTYLMIEVKEGENWVRFYKSYDEFISADDDELAIKSAHYLALLVHRHGEI